ncbi:hypothetical protein HYALB_00000547 [Hymenoscyphus albidus]|uniref:Transcription factor Iwr1 domain-containing protein n=1 Tax=Hymenoscyphus albidus TaxID=595503 RepID=A0A9N9M2A5_9HELO|nr:hypothetical protein HYALB_00000547 [Hymenoscyphus albidus]
MFRPPQRVISSPLRRNQERHYRKFGNPPYTSERFHAKLLGKDQRPERDEANHVPREHSCDNPLPSIEDPEANIHFDEYHGVRNYSEEPADALLADIRARLERLDQYDALAYQAGFNKKRSRFRTPTPYPRFDDVDSDSDEPSPKRARHDNYEHPVKAYDWAGLSITPGCPYHTLDRGVSSSLQLTVENVARLDSFEGLGGTTLGSQDSDVSWKPSESVSVSEDTLCGSSSGYEGDVEKGFGAPEKYSEDEEEEYDEDEDEESEDTLCGSVSGYEGDVEWFSAEEEYNEDEEEESDSEEEFYDGVMVHMAQMEEGRDFQENFDEF